MRVFGPVPGVPYFDTLDDPLRPRGKVMRRVFATAALVFLLSLRLRRREIETIGKIGGGRWHVVSMLLTEIVIVLILGGGLATTLTILTWRYGSAIIESYVLS